MIKPAAVLAGVREKRPFLDHLFGAYGRYTANAGNRLAAAVTFYWFLSLFPLLLLAVWATSLVLGDTAGQDVTSALEKALPRQLAETIGTVVEDNAGNAGLLGLVGLLLSGLGWIDALREAIRTIWHQGSGVGNVVTRKVFDIVSLAGLFVVIAASVVFGSAATAATGQVLDLLGLEQTTSLAILTNLLGYLISGVVDTAVFLYLFMRLPRVRMPFRQAVKGALLGAAVFEVLKFGGAFYVARTTSRGEATYGTFAVVVGLLLFLNLVSRLVLFAAAFTVTAPYDSGVGQGTIVAQEHDEGRRATMTQPSWARRDEPVAPLPQAVAPVALPPGARKVELAAHATAGAVGMLVVAVGIHAVRSLAHVVRR